MFDEVKTIKNYNESILESMSNAVITLNSNNQIATCNRAGMNLFQLRNLEELLHKNVSLLFPADINHVVEKINQVNNEASILQQESLMDVTLGFGKNEITVNITILPLFSANNERIGVIIMIEDISSEKRMKLTMSRYMSPDLAEKVLQSGNFSLGGTSAFATILFTDIRNFTNFSEALGAEETVKLLNEYFTLMVDCIHDEGGMLDKFIGDAMMAVFGNLLSHEDDADRAVRSAIAMMKALMGFNRKRAMLNLPPVHHGIGINTDKVVSGNIGSTKRMDFTVIGDGVNLASRIESLCKHYGANILISEFTYKQLKSTYRTRHIDKVIVKGKNKPVSIYEIIDFHDKNTFPNQIDVLNHFDNGIEYYNEGLWDKAISSFEAALQLFPEDKPSQVYIDRCRILKENPPAPDWQGVWVMKKK